MHVHARSAGPAGSVGQLDDDLGIGVVGEAGRHQRGVDLFGASEVDDVVHVGVAQHVNERIGQDHRLYGDGDARPAPIAHVSSERRPAAAAFVNFDEMTP